MYVLVRNADLRGIFMEMKLKLRDLKEKYKHNPLGKFLCINI
jgi:hypothetical protein